MPFTMQSSTEPQLISADDEWSPLRSVIVGRAEHSAFPSEPAHMIRATMPNEHHSEFTAGHPFPADIVAKAQQELDDLARVLEEHGVSVTRPREVDWVKQNGYTGAMARDCLMTVGNTLVESCFTWRCRRDEVKLAYSDIIDHLSHEGSSRICRAPNIIGEDTIYNGLIDRKSNGATTNGHNHEWAINNSRPAFDAADFLRFGKVIIGQLSHVTNRKGVAYLQAVVPDGYTVEILDTDDEHAMHIDATILPLRSGVLIYNPLRVTKEKLRQHQIFADWSLHPFPFTPQPRKAPSPPMYMCSPWLVLNALSLNERQIILEENDTQFAEWLRKKFDMDPILLPFQHVHSLGGSFHCATVDLVRSTT